MWQDPRLIHRPFWNIQKKMNPWGMMGCIMSHIKALEKAEKKDLQGNKAPGILVLEDDAVASETLAQSKSLVQRVASRVASEYPRWKCVLLCIRSRAFFLTLPSSPFEVTYCFPCFQPSFIPGLYLRSQCLTCLPCLLFLLAGSDN